MKIPRTVLTSLIGSIIFLSVVQTVISNWFSTSGILLAKLESEINVYKKDNSLLSEELLSNASLSTIASSASQLGFVESKSQVFLSTPLPLAKK